MERADPERRGRGEQALLRIFSPCGERLCSRDIPFHTLPTVAILYLHDPPLAFVCVLIRYPCLRTTTSHRFMNTTRPTISHLEVLYLVRPSTFA